MTLSHLRRSYTSESHTVFQFCEPYQTLEVGKKFWKACRILNSHQI